MVQTCIKHSVAVICMRVAVASPVRPAAAACDADADVELPQLSILGSWMSRMHDA